MNYLITCDIFPKQDYLISYYEQKHIQVINLNNLDEELLEESKQIPLDDEIGQRTYVCLQKLIITTPKRRGMYRPYKGLLLRRSSPIET